MIRCGSAQIALSVITPNCTPPAYDRIDTPMPMSPDCGTQNIIRGISAPAMCSASRGPGTLVITAVPLRARMFSTWVCTTRGTRPTMPSSMNASSAW